MPLPSAPARCSLPPAQSRRSFLASAAALGAAACAPALGQQVPEKRGKSFAWRLVSIKERDYVRMKDVKEFYLFKRYERSGSHLWLRSDALWLKASSDSADMYINDIKFCMSLPAIEREGDILISRMDLAKLIEPVLRPRLISSPIVFDTVVIDPGHGGSDPGSPGLLGHEKTYTLDTSLRLKALLEKRGLKTRMTRATDATISEKSDRTKVANALPNSIFISIHYNQGHRSAAGIETYALSPHGAASTDHGARSTDFNDYNGNDRDSENIALATALHAMSLFKLKCLDRGIRRARWTVLTGLERAGILFEGGFLSHPEEAAQINNPAYREHQAEALCAGILRYRDVLLNRRKR